MNQLASPETEWIGPSECARSIRSVTDYAT